MGTVHHFSGSTENDEYEWEDIIPESYAAKAFEGVVKHVLVGPKDGAPNFVVRYFQLEPGSSSRLERHAHDHGVVILHGEARVQLNDDFFTIGPMDSVYVAGNDLHQFSNIGEKSLGFICVIEGKIEERK
jgi:quercetin dioxygenase-like cupin family protein